MNDARRRFLVALVSSIASSLLPVPLAAIAAPDAKPSATPDWKSVLVAMFPHPGVDPSLYDVTVEALQGAAAKDAGVRQLLDEGWARLERESGGDWRAAGKDARTHALQASQGAPFFQLIRRTAAFTFYASPKVWEAFGYDGDAWRFGGYLARGLDTLDWLPNPPAVTRGH